MTTGAAATIQGAGPALISYATNGGAETSFTGAGFTQTWFDDDGQPAAAFLKVWFTDTVLLWGVDPFTGTGSYQDLWDLMFMQTPLGEPSSGCYTEAASPPAPDFSVVTYDVGPSVTAWVAKLEADLVWFADPPPQPPVPPLTLTVSSLQLSIKPLAEQAQEPALDFDAYGRQLLARTAAERGLELDPSAFPRRGAGR